MRATILSAATLLLVACGGPEGADAVAIANNGTTATPAIAVSTPRPPAPSETSELNSSENKAAQSTDDSNGGVVSVLSSILTSTGQLNGARITAVRQTGRCKTTVSAGGMEAMIDWSSVPDWLSRNEGGRVVIPIISAGETYTFSVPQAKQPEPIGDAGATVESAFGSLADSCAR